MRSIALLLFLPWACLGQAAELPLDERPAQDGEWGYRPESGSVSQVTPPGFSWRPQASVVSWELECFRGEQAEPGAREYQATKITWNVHCPPRTLAPGKYTWRYRGADRDGRVTAWSRTRTFEIAPSATALPLPERGQLLARIPKSHPRLFIRPEDLPRLRAAAQGPLAAEYRKLVAQCERLLKKPPPTAEPPKYPPGTVPLSEPWREIWWGNRTYTVAALDGAATLGFTRLLDGNEQYGQLARRILMECAQWDPVGATGYRYNDEAGMPYAYHFSRTYTYIYDLLTEEERQKCRAVMKIRGDEMFRHLAPRHLWQPYASHSNRAWHKLGEVGVAFLGEVEGADDWVWFAMNVFANVYPVWCDDDGGWHEGGSYWASYLGRFTWWADVMRSAMGIDAYQKPYFSKIGYWPMYVMPPGKVGAGFGDLVGNRRAKDNVGLMSVLAAQAGNGHWQWYVEQMGGPEQTGGYVGFVRGALAKVEPKPPGDLPTSRVFNGIGQAYLNSSLQDAANSVQVAFKSSPMGTQSHGYDANNAFQLWAYGQRLLLSSGYRDVHGSEHHRLWMWTTRSTNNITVNGQGQVPHSASSKGRIVAFKTTASIDAVVGEAAEPYRAAGAGKKPGERLLDRYTRTILFAKPDLVVIFDRIAARHDSTFEYWLHSPEKFQLSDQGTWELRAGDVVCPIQMLTPQGLKLTQTDQYDPNPRPRLKLREWHLTASTPEKSRSTEFVALLRPHRKGQAVPRQAELKRLAGGYLLTAALTDGSLTALLPVEPEARLAAEGLQSQGEVTVQRRRADGSVVETLSVAQP